MRPCRRAQRGGRPRAAGVSRSVPCSVRQLFQNTLEHFSFPRKMRHAPHPFRPPPRPVALLRLIKCATRHLMQTSFSIKIHSMTSPKYSPKPSRPPRRVRFLPRPPAPVPDQTPAQNSCVARGVGGTAPDQREGRGCISPRLPDYSFHSYVSTARGCPTVPPAGSPAAFQTFRESWIWRPGLGTRLLASLLMPISCTLSQSYTNLHCMSCKM